MVIIVSHILKAYIVKAMVFPLAMYRCKSWTIKKAEHERSDAFKLYCWRRFLRVPWTARRSNQLILKEISSEYSLEGLILKFQYLGHLMQRANSLEKNPDAGKDWRQEKGVTEDEVVRWHYRLNGHEFEQSSGDSEGQGSLAHSNPWGRKKSDMTDWTTTNCVTKVGTKYLMTFFKSEMSHLSIFSLRIFKSETLLKKPYF